MNARRVASLAGTVAVTVIAAVGSYDHMRELALEAGQPALLAALLPLSVDGMILVATLALGDGRRHKWSAWLAFLVGVAASLAANVIVADPDAISRVVSAWPAVALLLTVEVLARAGKAADPVPMPIPAPVMPVAPAMPMPTEQASDQPIADTVPMPIADVEPPESAKQKPRNRKHVVPAHPESAKADVAEIVKRADELKPQLGTWKNVADEIGIGLRTLQNYRKAVAA